MASGDDDNEENDTSTKIIKGCDKEEGSNSSSSSLPAPTKIALKGQSTLTPIDYEVKMVCNTNLPQDHPNLKQTSPLSFNPKGKGTKKQKRCDYDSDDRSYDGLGLEYKRRNLLTTARKDSYLPGKTKMIDFEYQGNKTWGDRLLFETLKNPDIDTLVGLATSYNLNFDGNIVDGISKLALEQYWNTQKNVGANIPSPLSPSFTKTAESTDETVFHNPQRHNPLLSVTYDSPLPPSHIYFIKSRALHHTLPPSHKDPDRRKTNNKNNKRSNIDSLLNDPIAVAVSIYLEECLTASLLPLAGLHVLRCRALEAMSFGKSEFGATPVASFGNNEDDDEQRRRRREIRYDNSLSYALQPTAPHPITGEKVKLDMNRQIRWKEENAFQEWTLPPEEAILKLMEQGVLSNDFPYHFVPDASRSWTSSHSYESNHHNCKGVPHRSPSDNGTGSSIDDGNNHIDLWAKSYDMNPGILSANKEIFDIFLPQKATRLVKNLQQSPVS